MTETGNILSSFWINESVPENEEQYSKINLNNFFKCTEL